MLLTLNAGPPTPTQAAWSPANLPQLAVTLQVALSRSQGKLWQDAAKTVPAVANNDPVWTAVDPFGGPDFVVSGGVSSRRPLLKTDGSGHWWLETDGVDDGIEATLSFSGSYTSSWSGRLLAAGNFPMFVVLNASNEELRTNAGTGVSEATTMGSGGLDLTTSILNTDAALVTTSNGTSGDQFLYRDNGETNTTNLSPGTPRTVNVVRLGQRFNNLFANARFYGVVVTSAVVSAGDRANLLAYLKNLYT